MKRLSLINSLLIVLLLACGGEHSADRQSSSPDAPPSEAAQTSSASFAGIQKIDWIQTLNHAVDSSEQLKAVAALEGIGRREHYPVVIAALAQVLADPSIDEAARIAAIQALGTIKDPDFLAKKALFLLEEQTRRPEAVSERDAFMTIVQRDAESWIRFLSERLAESDSSQLKSALNLLAENRIAQSASPSELDSLLSIMESRDELDIRMRAGFAVTKIFVFFHSTPGRSQADDLPPYVNRLENLLLDENPNIRRTVFKIVRSMMQHTFLNHIWLVDIIEKGLMDESKDVRMQALMCLNIENIQAPLFSPTIIEIAESHEDSWMRFRAAQILEKRFNIAPKDNRPVESLTMNYQ